MVVAAPKKVTFLQDLRYQAEYVGLRFLIGLVRLFPLDLAWIKRKTHEGGWG